MSDWMFDPAPDAADAPVAGFYQLLRTGRPPQPVCIFFSLPVDPDTGERMDRRARWHMIVNGQPAIMVEEERVEFADPPQVMWNDVWPYCRDTPIPKSEYLYLVARIEHARAHDADDAFATPTRRINLDKVSMPL